MIYVRIICSVQVASFCQIIIMFVDFLCNKTVSPGLDHLLAVVDALQPHPVEEVDIWNKILVLKLSTYGHFITSANTSVLWKLLSKELQIEGNMWREFEGEIFIGLADPPNILPHIGWMCFNWNMMLTHWNFFYKKCSFQTIWPNN